MYLVITTLLIMFVIETCVKIFNKSFASNPKKMKILKAVELAIFSPFIVSGLVIMKKEPPSENISIIVGISFIIIILAIRVILITLKDMQEE